MTDSSYRFLYWDDNGESDEDQPKIKKNKTFSDSLEDED